MDMINFGEEAQQHWPIDQVTGAANKVHSLVLIWFYCLKQEVVLIDKSRIAQAV